MGKFCIVIMIVFVIVGAGALLSHSDDAKELFVKKCGSCHQTGKEAPPFAPTKYASIQWERFFDADKHKRKKDITSLVTVSEIEIIKKYLMSHAADSDQPEAVGFK